MAHFAKVENGIVTAVIVAEQEFFDKIEVGIRWNFADDTPGEWVKTSYNMRAGVYIDSATNLPAEDQSVIEGDEARERKNFAGIGDSYDTIRNAFIAPKFYNSWVLNEDNCQWEAPEAKPDDGKFYVWDEDSLAWDEMPGD